MSFEVQDLHSVIRLKTLLNLNKNEILSARALKHRFEKVKGTRIIVELSDIETALQKMAVEGLIAIIANAHVSLTEQGERVSGDWRKLLLKNEPIIEVVAGLTDGSITALVVIISALIARLGSQLALFAAFLTLAAVAITNFSSFLLGGITEDTTNIATIRNLIYYSLNDIPDSHERDKSLLLAGQLFVFLYSKIRKANLFGAFVCSLMSILAGLLPIITYILLPSPWQIIASLTIIGCIIGVLLVGYRSKRARVHWKVTLVETISIIIVAVLVSLILGIAL